MRREKIWYVIMNSNRARILQHLPMDHEPAPEEIMLEAELRKLRDTLGDRPTRSYASAGGGRRSAVEPGTDPLREDMGHFLRDVFDLLERKRSAGKFEGLVLIGSPEIVGLWREMVPDALRDLVRREVTKNLVQLPGAALVTTLRRLMANEGGLAGSQP